MSAATAPRRHPRHRQLEHPQGRDVGPNTGDGVQLIGNSNNLSGATVESNTGNGVVVTGGSNRSRATRPTSNTLDGFNNAAGAGNNYSGNSSNTGGKENGGAEYRFVTAGVNGGSNRADGINVPSAAKGCTSFARRSGLRVILMS